MLQLVFDRRSDDPPRAARVLSFWGIAGVTMLLGSAIWRLSPIAVHPLRTGQLEAHHWVILIIWVLGMAYAEGYRGFHTRFSPRTAARALYLAYRPSVLRGILAPFFSMGFFGATRRVMITAWSITSMIVCLVLMVHQLEQPWRGIVDAGVVVGLAIGLASLLWFFVRGLVRGQLPADPQVPENRQAAE